MGKALGGRPLQVGRVTGFVQYAPMLLLSTVSPQDAREQNIAIKVYLRKSWGEHIPVTRGDALRLTMIPKRHFRQSYSGNIFQGSVS